MKLRTRGFRGGGLVLLPAALILAPALVSASPIIGEFGFSGPGVAVYNSLGAAYIEFCSQADPTCASAATATGDFGVSGPGTGSFSALTGANTGVVDNVTNTTPPLLPYTYLPVGVPVSIDDYVALAGFPTWDFQADLLAAATCTTTPTQMCLGPFQLNQNGPNVSVTMDVFGMLINTADGSTSNLDITFTGQYDDTTIGAVETAAESSAGVFSNSWSATANATVPEPGTASMMLLAGAGLALLSHIRRQRKS
jgi:hypothetical protein